MTKTSYDEIPYTKYVHQQTVPDSLATFATLLGLQPPPVERCRVLELGCASGVNTMAMAMLTPHSEFIGIDASIEQIKEGQAHSRQLGLTNVSFQHLNIMDLTPEFGQFDYIIVHGVFSWVPTAVREQILYICRHNLQPNGIAYISYNISPGWDLNNALRKMMLYHTRQIDSHQGKLQHSKDLLRFFKGELKEKFDSYSLFLRKELETVSELEDNYFFHEYLEDHNDPLFFHDFIEWATRHGLQYVGDTRSPFSAFEELSNPNSQSKLNVVETEQYLDFLRNNCFRETMLCQQEQTVNRQLSPHTIDQMYIAAPLKPTAPSLLSATTITPQQAMAHLAQLEKFDNLMGETVISVASPLLKAICLCLGEVWPQTLHFSELMQRVTKLLQRTLTTEAYEQWMSTDHVNEVKITLIEFFLKKIVELHVYPPQFTLTLSERPLANPLARLHSEDYKEVPNLRCETFPLNFESRWLLKYLDGTNDRQALSNRVLQSIKEGKLMLYQDDTSKHIDDLSQDELQTFLDKYVDDILQNLARKAFFVA